jgi:hypothetical protein
MRKFRLMYAVLFVGLTAAFAGDCLAANNDVIMATNSATWKSDQGESKKQGRIPLVEKVKQGDTLEIQIAEGIGPHGFITIKGEANDDATNPAEAPELVWACGQPETEDRKNAPLHEIDCTGTDTKFGTITTGTMKFEVTNNFKGVNFWCVQHTDHMWGKLELAP